MVDNPEKLCTISLRKFVALLKYDQLVWKKQVEQCIDQIHQEDKQQSSLNDQRKRKHHRTDDDRSGRAIDFSAYEVKRERLLDAAFQTDLFHIHRLNLKVIIARPT